MVFTLLLDFLLLCGLGKHAVNMPLGGKRIKEMPNVCPEKGVQTLLETVEAKLRGYTGKCP
jgi:hypothetical protein